MNSSFALSPRQVFQSEEIYVLRWYFWYFMLDIFQSTYY
jgi:hypothetical protein